MLSLIKKLVYSFGLHQYLARKRFLQINALLANALEQSRPIRILEVGCHNGRDFVAFLATNTSVEIVGIDLEDHEIDQSNFSFLKADAESLPFEDGYFDLVVSIGVLEHIRPIEKLCRMVSEIDRVGKSHVVVVPSISTLIEPHTASFIWQLRQNSRKKSYFDGLNFFSDESWLSFNGFKDSSVSRYWLIPGLISNTYIVKKLEKES